MKEKPIYSAACPCCAGTLVHLTFPKSDIGGEPLRLYRLLIGPITWNCANCGFALLGLAVPLKPELQFKTHFYTCMEVIEQTEVT